LALCPSLFPRILPPGTWFLHEDSAFDLQRHAFPPDRPLPFLRRLSSDAMRRCVKLSNPPPPAEAPRFFGVFLRGVGELSQLVFVLFIFVAYLSPPPGSERNFSGTQRGVLSNAPPCSFFVGQGSRIGHRGFPAKRYAA